MNSYPFSKRLMTITYITSLAVMMGYTLWLYKMGSYRSLWVPAFVTLVLLAALLMHLGQGLKGYISQVLLVGSTYLTVLSTLSISNVSVIWLGLPITSAFILLPLWLALVLTGVLGPLVWLFISHPTPEPPFYLGYVILLLLLALPRWEHARRRALLQVTDPYDCHCRAYNYETLKERLNNEFQRAAMLNKRLAVLVIHLQQLDMAEEQFGSRAKIALLDTLCSEVIGRCRDHDILGRAGEATFWLVLPDTSESGALLVRERLQHALSQCVLVETGHLEARIAACLPHKESFERYIQRLHARAHALANG